MKTQKTPSNEESTSSPEATSSRKGPPRDALRLLSEAIRKERAPAEGDGNAEEQAEGDEQPVQKSGAKPRKAKPKLKNLEAAAEALGIPVEELYTIEIPAKAKGAKPYTLGQLKDLAADDGEFQVRKLRLDTDRSALEAERVAAEAELNAVLQSLPADAIKPEQMQKLRNTLAARQQKERARTLEVIPEWQDEAVRTADLKGMLDFARSEYGLPETYLVTHMHAGLVRLMRDAWRNATTIKKALEAVEEQKTTTPPKSGAPKPTQRRQAAGPATRTQGAVGRFMDQITTAANQLRQ